MRQFCFGSQTRRLAFLALVGFVGCLVLSGFPSSATKSSRAARRLVSDPPQDQQPEFVTNNYRQTNFVSDLPGFAQLQDPLLINPWGIAQLATSPFWVANEGTSTATLYLGDIAGSPLTKNSLNVTIPGSLPTGAVASSSSTDFTITSGGGTGPARFIFASITGNIVAWRAGSVASIQRSNPGHVYTGLALGNNGVATFLYAADFANKKIDVYNNTFASTTLTGTFTDPAIPVDFAPYNIQNLGGTLFVAYAKINPTTGEALPGAGNGLISKFDTNGGFLGRLISNGPLNAPWGLTVSPAGFGAFGNRLLVGNFGDGKINAFDITTGAFVGTLNDELSSPIIIPGLWAITFGNGVGGGDTSALYFSAGYGHENHGLFGSLRSSTPAITSIQFASSVGFVLEGNTIDISVNRSGDLTVPSTVNYATFDGDSPNPPPTPAVAATQGKDYLLAAGTLSFAVGQSSKTFTIFIPDDSFQEGPETINLVLSNPTGAALGGQSTSVVTITDNDTPPPTTNPIDDAQFFVRQHYLDFLNRVPDAGGLAFWTGTITSCGADTQCTQVKRINASAAFFLSTEFQKSGLTAYLAPKAAFGVIPLYGRFEIDTQALQQNLVFGTPGFDAQLEANKSAFFADFVTRPEFLGKYPATQSGSSFIDALIVTIQTSSGVDLTPRRPDLVNEYLLGTTQAQSRARVVRKATEYPEEVAAEFNSAFVAMQYFGYLRRDPDAGGFAFWLAKLNAFNGSFVNAEMVKAFINSSEYRQRFGP